MNCCFADDSIYKSEIKKNDYPEEIFWKNFRDWEKNSGRQDFSGIYNSKRYDTLRDPDALSQNLYIMHENIWNFKCHKFHIPQVKKLENECKLKIDEKNIILSSDSFISVYWHWRDMQPLLKKIADFCGEKSKKNLMDKEIENFGNKIDSERKEKCFYDKNWNKVKKFIWFYLQKANTIGGFVVFPCINNSINTRRGNYGGIIKDRFDLTLECIRRAYQYDDFYKNDFNPLFGISEEDKEFFRMFGSFENYAKFSCLNESYDSKHNWVTEDCSAVYDLMSENGEKTLLKEGWPEKILPCDYTSEEEKVAKWWTFYRNIMDRLNARNKQIEKLLSDCSEDDMQRLYNDLRLD
jgi:hypothetical protein